MQRMVSSNILLLNFFIFDFVCQPFKWSTATPWGVLRNLIMPFGPLGDVADTAGPTTAEGIKSGQYTCFESRTGAQCTFG